MSRLKSCSYCGRIHDADLRCSMKPKYVKTKAPTEEDRLRGLQVWKKKRAYIRRRDNLMCQVCVRNLHNTYDLFSFKEGVQVHHIQPIRKAPELWLDDDNLICLCKYHHELAEKGYITKEELKGIVAEQLE